MKMTLEGIKSMLPNIMKFRKSEIIKLSTNSKKYDYLENTKKNTQLTVEKIDKL